MRIAIGLLALAAVLAFTTRDAVAETPRPTGVFVTLSQITDQVERAAHVEAIRARLHGCTQLANKVVDINVTRFAYVVNGATVELQLELGFVLSTSTNEIISVANQTAKLVLPASRFRVAKLPALRREVLDTAIGELIVKLRRARPRPTV